MEQNYEFSVEGFSGPFDLLLHLAKTKEIEISTISLNTLIDQYIDFIQKVQELGLDVRSSYLEMAAELIRLKSLSILNHNQELEIDMEEEEIFDREYFVEKLLEYKKYQKITKNLNDLIDKRTNFLGKKPNTLTEYRDENFKTNFDINEFYDAVNSYLIKKQEEAILNIELKEIKISDILIKLETLEKEFNFTKLIDTISKIQFVSLFLAILEALKLDYVSYQIKNEDIIIYPKNKEN